MKRLAYFCSIILATILFSNYAYANQGLSPSLDSTDILAAGDHAAVLIDRTAGKVLLADLKVNEFTSLSDGASSMLDVEVVKQSEKIVLLKKTSRNAISKTVFSYQGAVLSKSEIPLSLKDGDKIKWVAPVGKANERIMVQRLDAFNLYQYPWKKPSVSYDAKIVDKGYESVSVWDWDFKSYPYLAIKYIDSGIMTEDYYIKTVNLYSKKEFLFKDFNTDVNLQFSGGNLAITTSYVYQPVPANASRPDAADTQPYYQLVNIDKGIKDKILEGIFADKGNLSGWRTEFINNQLFVGDLAEHTWSLYSANGAAIVTNQAWPGNSKSKFAGYSAAAGISYFLEYHSGKASITAYPIQ
ncbi:hypothetical protein [Paenibacillus rhizophilus]|uniref:Uncharacterized protein n=1 Tax=Paenibacillus rhizophilus TaxID=1850366 RepID=A0A3N9NYQ6_9BACL|nr:hypothetical protein [Paenibacillus rhizophilus]RQW09041.1 hypothetical protein EH198_20680 [Paenibacillus rhizophilus]